MASFVFTTKTAGTTRRYNFNVLTGTAISHYKVLEKLGEGGMGVVYRAEDTKLDRPVALKFLPSHLLGDEEVSRRFQREAKAAAALDHANICTVHDSLLSVSGRCGRGLCRF